MRVVSTFSSYGLMLFGLAVFINVALFVYAWLRGR